MAGAENDLVLIRCDLLIDGVSDVALEKQCVVYRENGRIGSGAIVFVGADVDDGLKERIKEEIHVPVLMPGMWDCHVHLLGIRNANFSVEIIQTPKGLLGARCVGCLQDAIEMGFTSLRDVGGIGVELKAGVLDGSIRLSPHIYSAGGFLSITGGHGDFHDLELCLCKEQLKALFEGPTLCDGPWEGRRGVRGQIRRGADLIKVMASGGVLSRRDDPHHQEFTNEELKAIVEEAASKERCVAAHCHGAAGISSAIQCGVRTIEHGTYLTREQARSMVSANMILVPTVYIQRRLYEFGAKAGMPAESIEKMSFIVHHHFETMKMAYQEGVTIALGTDIFSAGADTPVPFGNHAVELEYMCEFGMSPMEALKAATANGPLTLGPRAPKSGCVKVGYDADLLLLAGNPLEDITILQKAETIIAVVKDGRIVVDRR